MSSEEEATFIAYFNIPIKKEEVIIQKLDVCEDLDKSFNSDATHETLSRTVGSSATSVSPRKSTVQKEMKDTELLAKEIKRA
jgi:hypothetical protein